MTKKVVKIFRTEHRRLVKDIIFILMGVASATIGLKCFLLPNGFVDGGVTGISLLINRLTGVDVSILIFSLNLPFIYLGSAQVSKTFAFKTFLAISTLAFVVHFFDLQYVTQDKLLIALFGGVFLGGGIGLAIRGGCVIDGTEVLAVFVSKKSTLTLGDFIALFNIILFAVAAFLIGIEVAMYSMLTYFAASKAVEFIVTGIEEYIGVTIISEKSQEIRENLIHNLGRAVTVYKGEGGFGKKGLVENDRKILFSVVTRLEVQNLVTTVEQVDPSAFIIQHTVNETRGGMIKKRPLHHH